MKEWRKEGEEQAWDMPVCAWIWKRRNVSLSLLGSRQEKEEKKKKKMSLPISSSRHIPSLEEKKREEEKACMVMAGRKKEKEEGDVKAWAGQLNEEKMETWTRRTVRSEEDGVRSQTGMSSSEGRTDLYLSLSSIYSLMAGGVGRQGSGSLCKTKTKRKTEQLICLPQKKTEKRGYTLPTYKHFLANSISPRQIENAEKKSVTKSKSNKKMEGRRRQKNREDRGSVVHTWRGRRKNHCLLPATEKENFKERAKETTCHYLPPKILPPSQCLGQFEFSLDMSWAGSETGMYVLFAFYLPAIHGAGGRLRGL